MTTCPSRWHNSDGARGVPFPGAISQHALTRRACHVEAYRNKWQGPKASPHALHTAGRLAAIYARVSSEEQRENQTIKTQIEAAKRWVEFQKMVEHPIDIADLYLDDGVSGIIALAERPAGKRLLDDAAHGKFALVLAYKIDRLGRDPRDILNATHRLDQLGVAVKSLTEEFDLSTPSGKFMFNLWGSDSPKLASLALEVLVSGS